MSDKANKMADELSAEVDKILEPLKKKLVTLILKREKKALKSRVTNTEQVRKVKKRHDRSESSSDSD